MERTENLNIVDFKPLISPDELKQQLPVTDQVSSVVAQSRTAVRNILSNIDPAGWSLQAPVRCTTPNPLWTMRTNSRPCSLRCRTRFKSSCEPISKNLEPHSDGKA